MANSRHIHVIGAGMSGLSAALQLTLMGERVSVYEAATFAGGRCRSWMDRDLECRLDNGNHLILSGNSAIQDYLYLSNALDTITGPLEPIFPFMDLATGERWTVQMNMGRMPWWIFDKKRRVPFTRARDYLSAWNIVTAGAGDTVAERLPARDVLYRRFWEPLTIAALNTEPGIASARLLAAIFWQTFGAGGKACIPLVPKIGLSETFVLPCLNVLRRHGTEVHYARRLRGIATRGDHLGMLEFQDEPVELGPHDWVVLAVPAWAAREILPVLTVPDDFRSIVNAHFKVDVPRNPAGLVGLVGGVAEWVFAKDGVTSVTVSAAERHDGRPTRELAALVWQDVAKLYDLDPFKLPPHKIFKEKFATFSATPAQEKRRPRTLDFRWKNLALAGEWTATGLPSTIEGAIRSGVKAAQVVARWG